MFVIGSVVSAVIIVPIALAIAMMICIVWVFNVIVREVMEWIYDLSMNAIADIESAIYRMSKNHVTKEVTKHC